MEKPKKNDIAWNDEMVHP